MSQQKHEFFHSGRFKGTKDNFDFLGFTFYNGTTAEGKYRPVIITSKKKLKQKRQNVKKWLYANMHNPIPTVGEKLKAKILGHYNYYGINGNYVELNEFYKYIKRTWFKTLRKRGQKRKIKHEDFDRIWNWLDIPKPKIYVNIWY